MRAVLSFLFSSTTAFLGLFLVYRGFRENHDRQKIAVRTAVSGFAAVIPAGLAEFILLAIIVPGNSIPDILIRAFIVSALIEELFKYLAFRLSVFPSPIFSTTREGVLYGLGAGLGFAVLENGLYAYLQSGLTFLRAITSVPLHAGTALIIAYFASLSACKGKPVTLRGIGAAIAIHGVYNFLILAGSPWSFISPFVLVLTGVYCIYLYRKT
ncbi:MAG: PrsW family glutamic-type intramembrane protease [Spirochaetia bacterium]